MSTPKVILTLVKTNFKIRGKITYPFRIPNNNEQPEIIATNL